MLAHELIHIISVNICCENLIQETQKIIKDQEMRLERFKDAIDSITSHEYMCYNFGCLNREKFKKDEHKHDDGC